MTEPNIRLIEKPDNWRDRVLAFGARWLVRPLLALPLPWRLQRQSFELAGRLRRMAPGIHCEPVVIAGQDGVVFTPEDPKMRILWFHGGGFVLGSPYSHRGMLSSLAKRANAAVFVPKYRLAPEDPFPAGVEDAESAVVAMAGLRAELGPFVLGGDSAGGTMAAVGLAHILAIGDRSVAGAMFVSPATDLNPDRAVPEANDLLFPLRMFHRIIGVYARAATPKDPRLSPVHSNFAGAPDILIQCCVGEYLEGDSNALAARLATKGAGVTLEKYQHLPHVFHFMAGSSPSADVAIQRLADFAIAQVEGRQ